MSPKLKLVTLQPEGIVRCIFEVSKDVIERISQEHKHLEPLSKLYSSFFGTLTQDGLIQIWGVGLFCRSVLSLSTTHGNCSWAVLRLIDQQIGFLVYSRGHGLYVEIISACSETGCLGSTQVEFPIRASSGFSQPFCNITNEVKFLDNDDNLVQLNLTSKSLQVSKPNITHVTFFTAFNLHTNLVLIGSESGRISLIDLSDQSASILDEIDLLKNDVVDRTKRKCNVQSDENMAIPLCCAGDELSGNFLVGTRANVLALVTLEVCPEIQKCNIKLNMCKGIPNAGVHSVLLHPAKDKILVHGWDGKVRLFKFPSMDFIQSFEWTLHLTLSTMSFLANGSADSPCLILASDSPPVLTLRKFEVHNQLVSPLNQKNKMSD